MSDFTTTPNYGLIKPTPDADEDQWGAHWNQNADTLDGLIFSFNRVTVGDVAPASPRPGDLFFDAVAAQLYVRYADPDSAAWVPAVNQTNSPAGQIFAGGWDASTNSPLLASGALVNGSIAPIGTYYIVTVGGTTASIDGNASWLPGDYVTSTGSAWLRVQASGSPYLPLTGGTVSGAVTLAAGGTLAGTFAGTPTFSGNHLYQGNQTFGSGSGGAGTGLTVNNQASIAHLTAAGSTTTYATGTPASAATAQQWYAGIGVSGKTGNYVAAQWAFNVGSNNLDNSSNSNPFMPVLMQSNFGGTKGPIGGLMVKQTQTSATADTSGSIFYNTVQSYLDLEFAAGSPNSNGIAYNGLVNQGAGATNWGRIEASELATARAAGSTLTQELVLNLIRTNKAAAATDFEAFIGFQSGLTGRGAKVLLLAGTGGSQWPLDSAGWIWDTYQQTTANPGAVQTVAQTAAGGLRWGKINFSDSALRSSGIRIRGTPEVDIGAAQLVANSAGLQIDIAGSKGAIASVATAGSGYQVGDQLYDGNDGIIQVSTVGGSGNITAAAYIAGHEPYWFGSGAPSSVSVTGGSGNGLAAFNVTWTTQSGLSINPTGQRIGFNGASPIAKPTIAGACAGNTAIKALLTALSNYGLLTDTTSA